jgi:hypothetical protein
MFTVFLDGASVFFEFIAGILFFLVAIFGLGFISIKTNRYEAGWKVNLLAAFSVGSVVLCVVSYFLVLLSHSWPFLLQPGSFIILFFAILVLLRGIWLKEIKITWDTRVFLAAMFVFLLLIIRLAFLKHIILPPYSDSPIHYQIVSGFLHPGAIDNSNLSLENILSNYYHFGFHSLAAWLTTVAKMEAVDAIALLGQLFLVIGPASIMFLVYSLTNDSNGALFAGLLAAIGWYMPAFAVNWGKFPAISALATMPSVLAFLKLRSIGGAKNNISLILGLMLFTGIALMHTRVIVGILLAIVCYSLSNKLTVRDELGFFQSVGYSVLYIISLWPLLQLLTDFYSGVLVVAVLLVLLPPAFQVFPRLSIAVFLFTFGAWLIGIAPTLIDNSFRTLLDKQFLEMMLYIPFSIMGGAGFAGIIKKLSFAGTLRWYVTVPLVSCVLLNFLQGNSIYPDPCCDYFQESDRLAFDWIQNNSSKNTLVLISTFESTGQIVGTDAGIWLLPLIGQPTNKLPFDIKWDSFNEIEKTCQTGAREVFIYVGGREHSFDYTQLAQAEWAKLAFKAGKTMIYQIPECRSK